MQADTVEAASNLETKPCLDLQGGYICGNDCDDVFTYDMPRMARIRNSRLGLLYYFLVIIIALYIGVYQMWYGLQYLAFADPDCSIRLTFRQPTSIPGCHPTSPFCEDAFQEISTLDYCCNSSCIKKPGGACKCPWQEGLSYYCDYYDGVQVSATRESSMLVGSYFRSFRQTLNRTCREDGPCRKLWVSGEPTSSYVAGVEDYTIMLEHSVMQSTLDIFKASQDIRGFLHVKGNSSMQQRLCYSHSLEGRAVTSPYNGDHTSTAPCYLVPATTSSGTDLLSVRDLLEAMDVSLDQVADPKENTTLRYEGFTVTLSIVYQNFWPWKGLLGTEKIIAVYELRPALTNSYKSTSLVWDQFGASRVQQDLRGMLLSVRPAGQLARFDFQAMLLTATTSLTLLAIASVVVKYLAIWVLHFKEYYKELVVHESPDFSDVRDWHAVAEKTGDTCIDEALEKLKLPVRGKRHTKILSLCQHPEHRQALERKKPGGFQDEGTSSSALLQSEEN